MPATRKPKPARTARSRLAPKALCYECAFYVAEEEEERVFSRRLMAALRLRKPRPTVALAAVRDLGLSMGEYASPVDCVHSVSVFLTALKKKDSFWTFHSLRKSALKEIEAFKAIYEVALLLSEQGFIDVLPVVFNWCVLFRRRFEVNEK